MARGRRGAQVVEQGRTSKLDRARLRSQEATCREPRDRVDEGDCGGGLVRTNEEGRRRGGEGGFGRRATLDLGVGPELEGEETHAN